MKKKTLIIFLLIIWVLAEAISEGLYDSGFKAISKIIQALMIVVPFTLIYINIWNWIMPVIYILSRLVLFDLAYNITRGLEITYCGSTTLFYDKWICPVLHTAPVYYLFIFILIISIVKFLNSK
jgi:hypothetical protein